MFRNACLLNSRVYTLDAREHIQQFICRRVSMRVRLAISLGFGNTQLVCMLDGGHVNSNVRGVHWGQTVVSVLVTNVLVEVSRIPNRQCTMTVVKATGRIPA